jgi:integrase
MEEGRLRREIDVHKHERRYETAIALLKTDKINEADRKLIIRFVEDLESEGIGKPSIIKYTMLLRTPSKLYGRGFSKANERSIRSLVGAINKSKYADWTKHDLKVTLKRFYKWLRKCSNDKDPGGTAWIKITSPKRGILPEELLDENDIARLLAACDNSRDGALTHCIWETGGRIAELLDLRRKHVQFDQYGAILKFSGKTGDRPIRIVESSPSLAAWFNKHPIDESDAPLWTVIGDKHHSEPLLYASARMMLNRLSPPAHRAKIKKRVNPHSFSNSRATYLASVLNERQMKKYLGWTTASKIPSTYVHLSGRDVDKAILCLNGIEQEGHKDIPEFLPIMCPRCQQANDATLRFCGKCGLPLRIEAALELEKTRKEADDLMSKLLEDPEVRTLLLAKLKEISVLGTAQEVPSQ